MRIAAYLGMATTVSEIMAREVATASPSWKLSDLERAFFQERISGFPVVNDEGELCGVVSRSDVVRVLAFERSREGRISDYFRSHDMWEEFDEAQTLRSESQSIADRLNKTLVSDLMSPATHVVDAAATIQEAAAVMQKNSIHRVPVVENGKLVGILSSLDIVAVVARSDL